MKKSLRKCAFRYSLFTIVLYNKVDYAKLREQCFGTSRHNT